jgi:hypothetical protein
VSTTALRDEHFMDMRGKKFVLYGGLLALAHERGIAGIDEQILQIPTEANGNVAIVKATVYTEDEGSFSGLGDASPQNVGKGIVPHLLRMASTRAKARALRDFCNVGEAIYGDVDEDAGAPPPAAQTSTLSEEAQDRFKARLIGMNIDPADFENDYGPISGLTMNAARNYVKQLEGEG